MKIGRNNIDLDGILKIKNKNLRQVKYFETEITSGGKMTWDKSQTKNVGYFYQNIKHPICDKIIPKSIYLQFFYQNRGQWIKKIENWRNEIPWKVCSSECYDD